MGRKKKYKTPIDPNTPICCICKKYIKMQNLISIGKNFVGLELYRHDSCYLYNLQEEDFIKLKTSKEIKLKLKKEKNVS